MLRVDWGLLATQASWKAKRELFRAPLGEPHPQQEQARPEGPCPLSPPPRPTALCHAGERSSQWFPGKPANTVQMGCIFRKASSPLPGSLPSFLMCAHSSIHPVEGGGLKEAPPPQKTLPPLGLFLVAVSLNNQLN